MSTINKWSDSMLDKLELRIATMETERFAYPVPVDNRIAYYEGQIEEVNAKWQAAEEKLREALDAVEKIGDERYEFQKQSLRMAETITGLRGKIGSRDAIIAQKNREMAAKEVALDEDLPMRVEARRLLLDQVKQLQDRLKVYEEHLPVRELTAFMDDAKLGALLRQMPKHYILFRAINAPAGWMVKGMGLQISRDTPEASLEALLKAKDGD